jgi:hypothetical protein
VRDIVVLPTVGLGMLAGNEEGAAPTVCSRLLFCCSRLGTG